MTHLDADERSRAYAGEERGQLRATIAALRESLETREAEAGEARSEVRAKFEAELSELRSTVNALREALEQSQDEGRAAAERAGARSADEIAQLRKTIQELRDAMEEREDRHREEILQLGAEAQREAIQLRATARALRDEFEEATARAEAPLREALAAADLEIRELRTTCQRLRNELDRLRGAARVNVQHGKNPELRQSRRRGERRPAANGRGVRARAKDLEIILDVAQRISGNELLDEVLEALVEMTSLAINCDRCSFFLNDPETRRTLHARRAGASVARRQSGFSTTRASRAPPSSTGQSIIVDDAYADPRFNPSIDRETGYVTKTVLCVPLRTGKGEIVGVAQALNKIGGFFTKNDQTLLEGIAAQAVPALRSSQTVERMKKARAPGNGVPRHRRRHHLADRSRSAAAAGDVRGEPDARGGAFDAVPP